MDPLGPNIKAAQAEAEITVDALAIEIGTSARLIQKWRAGTIRPRYQNLVKLAAALGKDVAWLETEHDGVDYGRPESEAA